MALEKPDRSLPALILDKLSVADVEGLVALYVGRSSEAERIFRGQLDLIREAEAKESRPIHKGGPLHNLGLSLISQGRNEEGLHNLLSAYVEDALNVSYGEEDEIDRMPAGSVLRDALRIRLKFLSEIKGFVAQLKKDGKWQTARNPEEILKQVSSALGLPFDNLYKLCDFKPIAGGIPLGFPQPWEKRVFIGANYDTHSHIIPEIKEVVVRKGYAPVIAYEVNISPDLIHHHSLLLLHTCKYAIIEITTYSGQLMELERAKDYGTTTLLLRSSLGTPALPPQISSMIQNLGYQLEMYRDIPDMKQRVSRFLR